VPEKEFFFFGLAEIFVSHSVLKMEKNCRKKDAKSLARSSYNLPIILSYPLAGLFKYLFIFWLHKNLPAKQALNSPKDMKE